MIENILFPKNVGCPKASAFHCRAFQDARMYFWLQAWCGAIFWNDPICND